jgi:hydroxyethylthiazole kinase-like uncharacterized protein yjeF
MPDDDDVDLADLLAARPLDPPAGDKRERGTVVVVGGPASCPGAALLAGIAGLRCGAGRVQLVVHPDVAAAVGVALPEAFVAAWDLEGDPPAAVRERLARADAVLVGSGLGGGSPADDVVAAAVAAVADAATGTPLLLDAGALVAAADVLDHDGDLALLPNTHEATALPGGDGRTADGDEPATASRLHAATGAVVAVRGERSAVAGPPGCWLSAPDAPALGTAGSGDVLAGAALALVGRTGDVLTGVAWAVAAHARAGQRLSPGCLAREVADGLPAALAEIGATARSA